MPRLKQAQWKHQGIQEGFLKELTDVLDRKPATGRELLARQRLVQEEGGDNTVRWG